MAQLTQGAGCVCGSSCGSIPGWGAVGIGSGSLLGTTSGLSPGSCGVVVMLRP